MKGWESLKALEEGKLVYQDTQHPLHWVYAIQNDVLIEICVKDTYSCKKGDKSPPVKSVNPRLFLSDNWEIYEEEYQNLRECPFCANALVGLVGNFTTPSYVCCIEGCGAQMRGDDAVKRWNTRA